MKQSKLTTHLTAFFLCLLLLLQNIALPVVANSSTAESDVLSSFVLEEEDSQVNGNQESSIVSEESLAPAPTILPENKVSNPPETDSSIDDLSSAPESAESSQLENSEVPLSESSATLEKDITAEESQTLALEEILKTSLAIRAATSTVVTSTTGFNDLRVVLSNGSVEEGWYHKYILQSGRTAYCVQQGVPLNNGNNSGYTSTEVTNTLYDKAGLADYFGRETRSGDSLWNELFTQLYIWELQGISPKSITDYYGYKDYMSNYKAYKNEVEKAIHAFYSKPSFNGQTVKLKVGQSITLTDTNGSLGYFKDSPLINTSKATVKKNGNKLTITATSNTKSTGKLGYSFDISASFASPSFYYNHPTLQDCIVANGGDPTSFVLNIQVQKEGTLRLVKTSEDGVVAGLKYTITSGGKTYNATTDSAGVISLKLPSVDDNGKKITYTATEVSVPGRYVAPASQTFTIEPETTTTINFQNNLKKGNVRLVKQSEDGIVAGLTLELTGGGQTYTRTTGGDGSINLNGLRVYDQNNNKIQYTAREINTPLRYVQPASQTFTLTEGQTTTITFVNNLKKGNVRLVKQSEDGIVAGLTLELTGGGQTYTRTTGSDGSINLNGLRVYDQNNNKIQYTAREVSTPLRYVQPASQTFTLTEGQTTTITFVNNLKKGNLHLIKAAEDNDIAGKQFRIIGGGQSYERTTGNGGTLDVTGLRVYDSKNAKIVYTATEINTPIKYVVPPAQTFTLEYGQTSTLYFENILKKWQLTVTKKDSQYNAAQGDATLVGAKYGLFKGDTLLDTYMTDSHNSFTTKIYHCDIDYTLREIEPSPGYLLDPTVYKVGVAPGDTHIELNPRYLTVTEDVIKGKIAIVKHTDNGETQIETPEVGAEFDVYLKSAGSYKNAKETERDHLICDEDGYDQTINLPHGVYVVEQTKSWDGRDMLPPFEVYIAKDSKTYRYIINNSFFEGYLKISKKDTETGNLIPYAGAGFQILDPTGDVVKMRVTYPKHMEIDTFYTSEDGTLVTPQKLPYGIGYQLIEVQAPYGYILDSTPVEFDITQDLSEQDNGIDIVKVEKKNLPQMGKVTIVKQGEVLSQITETDIYQPVYKVQGLFGAEYDLIATEDIITPDGTVRALAGQIVDTVKTGYTGEITSQGLYLGKYQAVETKAPEGYVLDSTPIEFELTYAGQEILLSKTEIQAYNERQKVKISLEKIMEQDEKYRAGMNGEILEVEFGLFATEEIAAKDGSVIPADGLLETVTMTEDGLKTFTTDIPFGKFYLQEIATNEKYILSDTKYPIEFAYQGQDIPVVEIMANEGKPIVNTLKRGKVQLTKVDMELPDNKLSGAVFEVYQDVDGDEKYTEDTDLLIGSMKETETGIYEFDRLTHGKYLLYEKTAPVGFIRDENYYSFEITEDGQVITIETTPEKGFENRPMKGTIRTTKVNADDPTDKLTGGIFDVYKDIDGNGKYTEDIDTLANTLTEIEFGVYELSELRYGKYLFHERTAPEGFIRDDNYYSFEIAEDGQLVEFNSIPGKDFPNHPKKGTIQTTKVNAEDPTDKLPGGVFDIYLDVDKNGKYTEGIDTLYGTLNEIKFGEYELTDIPANKYLFHERTAPEGFIRDNNYYPFEIVEDGQLVEFNSIPGKDFPNHPKKGTIQTTKVNAEDPTDKLTGGVFDVYKDVNKDGKYTKGIDKLYGTLTEVEFGFYELKDIPGGHYLFNERTAPKGFVRDKNFYPFEIAEDGQVIKFESIPGKDFPNHPKPPIPETGDNSNFILWISLSIGAAVIFSFLIIRKKRIDNYKKGDPNGETKTE